jgi:uroporphyrinogen III methyltransferase/synthase
MGKEYVAEGMLEAFAAHDLAGKRILLPRAAVARDLVPAGLARRGARVDVVEAYRTVPPEHLAAQAREVLESRPDCVTFTSSSTVRNLLLAAGAEALRGIAVASIGPITTLTARQLGVEVATQAKVFTVDGLVAAVLGLYTEMTPPSE